MAAMLLGGKTRGTLKNIKIIILADNMKRHKRYACLNNWVQKL